MRLCQHHSWGLTATIEGHEKCPLLAGCWWSVSAKRLLLANSLLKRSVLMPRDHRHQKDDLQAPVSLCPTGATGELGKERCPGNVQAPRISDYNLTDILSYYKVTSALFLALAACRNFFLCAKVQCVELEWRQLKNGQFGDVGSCLAHGHCGACATEKERTAGGEMCSWSRKRGGLCF